MSLGGYFAARSAAKDSRFAACVIWGAVWDYHELWRARLEAAAANQSMSSDYVRWVWTHWTPHSSIFGTGGCLVEDDRVAQRSSYGVDDGGQCGRDEQRSA